MCVREVNASQQLTENLPDSRLVENEEGAAVSTHQTLANLSITFLHVARKISRL